VLTFTIITNAQSWDDGMYHNGMNLMDWRGTQSLYTVSGKIIVDTSFTTSYYMYGMRPAYYYLDTIGNGTKNYQLFFGPYWYHPDNGTVRPLNGQSVVLKGVKSSNFNPPMLSVYLIDGNLWRDTVGVESWSGHWIHKTDKDSIHIYCPTDSLSYMVFAPNSMGSGMMGGGMMQWPDSIFFKYEHMIPDSMPILTGFKSVIGFHLGAFDSLGGTMMQMGSMGNGMMSMQKLIQIVFHISQDSLNKWGLNMSQLNCRYLDNNGNWTTASTVIKNSSSNTITLSQNNLYSFYAIASNNATDVENQKVIIPAKYDLEQNFPNPFNPSTTINFSLPKRSEVRLTVYNILGNKVAELANGNYEVGNYSFVFNAKDLPSGVYFYQLKTDNFDQVKKMQLIK
jgi:hypothetical protein